MSGLPAGWMYTEIGQIAQIETGNTPSKNNASFYGREVCFYKPGDLDIGGVVSTSNDMVSKAGAEAGRMLPANSLLVTCIGNLGKSALIAEPAICNQQINAVLPSRFVDPYYLYYWSCTIKPWLEENSSATTVSIINKSRFSKAPIRIPPVNEQRRIVVKIDSLTGKSRRARDHLDHIPRLAEKYKQAILAAAFRGELTRVWREKKNLPVSHNVLLRDVAEGFNYGSAAKSAKEGRVPVLRMGNIQDGSLDWTDLVFTDDAAEIAKYALKKGDVLFNRTNSPALVGKTALFNGEQEAIFAGYLIKVRCKSELLPEFLTYCLNAPNGRAYCWEVKTDGVSQSNINAKKLAAFSFDLPSVEEQAEIVRRIESAFAWIDRLSANATSARKMVDHLDQAILAKAFKGELVPQDPTDEPASILLERIRAERAAAPKARRGRKKEA